MDEAESLTNTMLDIVSKSFVEQIVSMTVINISSLVALLVFGVTLRLHY